ncbi:hypothetical protein GGS20DRAFT_543014 [Poronia punctata]|nr:hypothetical protein GGS20DRAFT_543014 [Poronia punctata]
MSAFARRQYVEEDGQDVWFWYTTPGIIIKYVVFLSILLLLLVWIVGGRVHAKRRLIRGQKPMAYHAWLLSRRERAQVDPTYRWPQPTYYAVYRPANTNANPHDGTAEYYGMHSMPPPPMYDPNRPPVYEGPSAPAPAAASGTSKVDPRQGEVVHDEYAPPPGPPPSSHR